MYSRLVYLVLFQSFTLADSDLFSSFILKDGIRSYANFSAEFDSSVDKLAVVIYIIDLAVPHMRMS